MTICGFDITSGRNNFFIMLVIIMFPLFAGDEVYILYSKLYQSLYEMWKGQFFNLIVITVI